MNPESDAIIARAEGFRMKFREVRDQIARVIVGQDEVIEQVLIALFCGGHCLLEGVPGLGKTLLVRTLSEILDLEFGRIQFTPDLMPADIIGTKIVMEDSDGRRRFEFQRGPIFAQLILADEINRATPKTQSALLEAMQEGSVTSGGETFRLRQPFLVMATQNPLEMDGTYPLPEAQLDRFFFKTLVRFPSRGELGEVLERTAGRNVSHTAKVMDGDEILVWKDFLRGVVLAPQVRDHAVRIVLATHPDSEFANPETRRVVRYGSSPRGLQAMVLAGKVRAVLDGRYHVSVDDLRASAHAVLRHRILLGFEGEAEGTSTDTIVDRVLEGLPRNAE
jgi:MoxR-like ATPase